MEELELLANTRSRSKKGAGLVDWLVGWLVRGEGGRPRQELSRELYVAKYSHTHTLTLSLSHTVHFHSFFSRPRGRSSVLYHISGRYKEGYPPEHNAVDVVVSISRLCGREGIAQFTLVVLRSGRSGG